MQYSEVQYSEVQCIEVNTALKIHEGGGGDTVGAPWSYISLSW